MKAICVTAIYLVALFFGLLTKCPESVVLSWVMKVFVFGWAIWLQGRILKVEGRIFTDRK